MDKISDTIRPEGRDTVRITRQELDDLLNLDKIESMPETSREKLDEGEIDIDIDGMSDEEVDGILDIPIALWF